ncbi:MAG: hypothetical protein JWN74_207 [Acidobacteriaceae bacterium]|nr:hypothetical protein [Acidobacteriaceae bacterium]
MLIAARHGPFGQATQALPETGYNVASHRWFPV